MHSTSAQMMAMANSFWPLAYSLKSYDLSLHPAFLSSAYRSLPTLPYPPPQNTTTPPTNSSSPPTTKSDKFSIDAILNKDKRSDSPSSVSSTEDIKKYSQTFLECDKLQESAFHRRQQRLFEAAHPYLGHTNAVQDLHHHNQHQSQQQQLSSAYRHLTESPRSQGITDKCEKKSSQTTQSWSKQAKGKRVRTIFTPEQLERMEAEFERQQYMVGTERYYLASSLNLTEAQVKVWFQNRRIKWRKQHLEQQKAKLNSMDIYRQTESPSDSESDDERPHNDDVISHMESLADPFQSPRESRGTQ